MVHCDFVWCWTCRVVGRLKRRWDDGQEPRKNGLVSTPRHVLFVLFATRGNDAVAGA